MFKWVGKAWQKLSSLITSPLGDGRAASWFGGGTMSAAGEDVTAHTAMLVSGVYRGVQLYGEVHGTLPLGVYRHGGKRRKYVSDHPTHTVLHERPNPETTAMTFWCLQEAYRHFHGNSYAEIEWNGRAQCIALWQLEPWRVVPRRNEETKKLEYLVDGKRTVAARDMVHLPNFSWCGAHGMSTIGFARESLGRILGAGRFASHAFESGGIPQGMVKHPSKMDKVARDNFRKEWKENAIKNKGGVGILWEGMDWVNMSMKPEDLQYLATLKDGTIDVCRWFNVPPHLLFELERAINNNAETGDLGFAKYGVIPLCLRWEQELNYKLLSDGLYCKHSFEGLLRGDSAARVAFLKGMREMGVYSPNDICELEDLDDIGPEGDIRVVNASYIPLALIEDYWEAKSQPGATPPDVVTDPSTADQPPRAPSPKAPPVSETPPPKKKKKPAPPPAPKAKGKLEADAFFQSELARMQRRENNALQRAAKKPGEFLKWMDEFYPRHSEVMTEVLSVPYTAWAETAGCGSDAQFLTVDEWVGRQIAATREELLRAAEVPAGEFESSIRAFIESRESVTV